MYVRTNSPLMAITEVNRLKYIRAVVNRSRRRIVYHHRWTASLFPADFTTDSVKLYTNSGGENLIISIFIRVSILLIRNLSLSIYGVLIGIIRRATAHEKKGLLIA